MAGISKDEVLHVARLARLELTDDEVSRFQEQLSQILEAVSKVSELDLTDVLSRLDPSERSSARGRMAPLHAVGRALVLGCRCRVAVAGRLAAPPQPRA